MATVQPMGLTRGEGSPVPRPIEWEGMTFRSKAEYTLAKAFDEHGVWVIPNARGRVGVGPRRLTRELDLLVNIDGWWVGIEVDGAPYHPAERAADDHRRDRLFRAHGLWVEHYDAGEAREAPHRIVAETILTSEAMRRSVGW